MKSLIKIGQIFGVWEVIGSSTENKRNLYLAKCGCGNIKQYPATVLRKLAKKSNCICSYQTNAIKEIGNKYNRLTIIEIDINKRLRNNHIHYMFLLYNVLVYKQHLYQNQKYTKNKQIFYH